MTTADRFSWPPRGAGERLERIAIFNRTRSLTDSWTRKNSECGYWLLNRWFVSCYCLEEGLGGSEKAAQPLIGPVKGWKRFRANGGGQLWSHVIMSITPLCRSNKMWPGRWDYARGTNIVHLSRRSFNMFWWAEASESIHRFNFGSLSSWSLTRSVISYFDLSVSFCFFELRSRRIGKW